MAKYIDGEQVVRELLSVTQTDGIYGRGLKRGIDLALAIVNRQDTADVVEVKHGEWESFEIPHMMRCTECGVSDLDIHRTKFAFCPYCGAKITTEGGKAD